MGAIERWVAEVVELTRPAAVHWCDGSAAERERLTATLVAGGTLERLSRPGSYRARTDPREIGRVEERTFICSEHERDAGPTNNWHDPAAMRAHLREHFRACAYGRTLYVLPFILGPEASPFARAGVQVTDSAYVALSMTIMTRVGRAALDGGESFVRCVHAAGAPGDRSPWPCEPEQLCVAHFPETREVWSYGSSFGGNALLGKTGFGLRLASVMGRDEGWLAEHMLLIKVRSPGGRAKYIAGAFPSGCGKSHLAMLESALPGWEVETLGDDIAWIRVGDDGRLRAVNPEAGFFGAMPEENPRALATIRANTLFTNGAYFTVRATQCPWLADEWDDPEGVPLDAILLGGRRSDGVPLVREALDWEHAVLLGATLRSEALGDPRRLRFDPFAMRSFCGYDMGAYFAHWLGFAGVRTPRVFMVNWFRRGRDGRLLWPGFGENARVLKWIFERCDGVATALATPFGHVPAALDTHGLRLDGAALAELLSPDADALRAEQPALRAHLDGFGGPISDTLAARLDQLSNAAA